MLWRYLHLQLTSETDSQSIFKCTHFLTGSRIASWLPSFSVEVMHTTNILGIAQANNSQLTAMVSSCLQSVDIVDFRRDGNTDCSLRRIKSFFLDTNDSLWYFNIKPVLILYQSSLFCLELCSLPKRSDRVVAQWSKGFQHHCLAYVVFDFLVNAWHSDVIFI